MFGTGDIPNAIDEGGVGSKQVDDTALYSGPRSKRIPYPVFSGHITIKIF